MKLIIDGNNIANATWFVLTRDGIQDDTVEKSIELFEKQIKTFERTFDTNDIYIAWDHRFGSSWRKEIIKEYKANRIQQEPLKHEVLRQCRITNPYKNFQVEYAEGDDVIYALCRHLQGEKYIISTDKDFIQVVQEGLADKLYNHIQKKFREIPEVDSILEKCLTGDSSDNIPGIKGIGPVRAEKIIKNSMQGLTNQQLEDIEKYKLIIGLKYNPKKDFILEKVIDILSTY